MFHTGEKKREEEKEEDVSKGKGKRKERRTKRRMWDRHKKMESVREKVLDRKKKNLRVRGVSEE